MCVININLTTTTEEGTTITNAEGRYRIRGSNDSWTGFTMSLNDPKTDDITDYGEYDLEVRVTNSAGAVSEWAASTFTITKDCSGPADSTCLEYRVQWLPNQQAGDSRTLNYIDCSERGGGFGNLVFTTSGEEQRICTIINDLEGFKASNPDLFVIEVGPCTF